MKIGFIGAGRMGRPMLARIAAAGHELTVLVRRPEARAALETETDGLRCADGVAETVRDADVVYCVVRSDDQVESLFLGAGGALAAMRPGATIVQHTTCDPATLERLASRGSARGIRVLDAALSGGPHDIAAGKLTLWASGDEGLFEQLRPLLQSYARPILFVGKLGNGQRVKLVNNALFVAQVGLAIDAVRLAGTLGIDEPSILRALPLGSSASRALDVIVRGGSVDAVAQRLSELMRKDVEIVRSVAAGAGADLGVLGDVLSSAAVEKKVLGSTS